MDNQQFLEPEWDYCLVLDSRRYDVFGELYEEYIDGSFEKPKSSGSSMPEWAYRTITGSNDSPYFSGNPFSNSLRISLSKLKWGASCDYDWTATDHVSEGIDVCKDGWDDDLGTIPPEILTERFRSHTPTVEGTDRTVLHYIQPHAPYLARGEGRKLTQIQKGIRNQENAEKSVNGGEKRFSIIGDVDRPKLERTLEESEFAQKVIRWLELDPVNILKNGLREAVLELYRKNLHSVLESVTELLPKPDGRVVVTAVHGEAFGEGGVWEHYIETHIPPLIGTMARVPVATGTADSVRVHRSLLHIADCPSQTWFQSEECLR